jgi:type IV secretory pathway VirB3-like protein
MSQHSEPISQNRRPAGIGCLGSIAGVIVIAAVIVAAIFAGLIILGIVAAIVVVGLLVLAIDRVSLALSPKRRARRADLQRSLFWRSGGVIDTTATIDEPAPGLGPDPKSIGEQDHH